MGTETTVNCTANDATQNTVGCSFTIKIYSPQEVVANLKSAVNAMAGSLNHGQLKGLMSQLDALLASIDDDNTVSICGQLAGFIAKIEQWIGSGVLTAAQGQPLIASANNLKQTYGCQ